MLNALSLPPETSLYVQVMLQLLSWGNQLWPKEKRCSNLVLLRRFGDTAVICLKVSCVLWLCYPGRDNSESQRLLKLCILETPGKHREGWFTSFTAVWCHLKSFHLSWKFPVGLTNMKHFSSLPLCLFFPSSSWNVLNKERGFMCVLSTKMVEAHEQGLSVHDPASWTAASINKHC